ncbi:hypothetical protein [Pseudoxanthomonas winnipegensis]|uniref:Uncharacterized protein n=1 Tax=Pseudoxanthomonas winnipegensis TaxID=2480810 RepID=A0A4V2HCI8_9GAMM|nr:hypothetical protein [Pseudoxanthomonas winnipegensis]TAA20319.1 hypothetical protein EA660_18180 [Pseudoxanthomonas winnipegensis]
MNRATVWHLLQEGLNAAEIAAAAGVDEDVARCMIDEAMGRNRGATIRQMDREALRELAA